jgi:transaldolase
VRLFLDAPNMAALRDGLKLAVVSGVYLRGPLAEERLQDFSLLVEECSRTFEGPVVAMLPYVDQQIILKQARLWQKSAPNAVPGVPLTSAGLDTIAKLTDDGVQVCGGFVATAAQGILAASAGAAYVSVPFEMVSSQGDDPADVVADLAQIFENYSLQTSVIAAELRDARAIVVAAKAGAHTAAVSLEALVSAADHPITHAQLRGDDAPTRRRR